MSTWVRILTETWLDGLKGGLKLAVLAMFIVIVYRSRFRQWTAAARDHFNFLDGHLTLYADGPYRL